MRDFPIAEGTIVVIRPASIFLSRDRSHATIAYGSFEGDRRALETLFTAIFTPLCRG